MKCLWMYWVIRSTKLLQIWIIKSCCWWTIIPLIVIWMHWCLQSANLIELLTFPCYLTSRIQPLDVSMYDLLKKAFGFAVLDAISILKDPISINNFSANMKAACTATFLEENINNSFVATGLCTRMFFFQRRKRRQETLPLFDKCSRWWMFTRSPSFQQL